jgi:hypothetical protein
MQGSYSPGTSVCTRKVFFSTVSFHGGCGRPGDEVRDSSSQLSADNGRLAFGNIEIRG